MLVSKHFFHEAASAWFQAARLEFPSSNELDQFVQKLNHAPLSAIKTIGVTWECEKFFYGAFSPNLHWCTGLRRLQVTVKGGLQAIEDKVDFTDELDANDFKALQMVQNICAVDSLTKLEIIPGQHKHGQSTKELQQYQRNIRAPQDYIVSRSASACGNDQMPAAPGGHVNLYEENCSIPKLKEAAWTYAFLGQRDRAAALVRLGKEKSAETKQRESNSMNIQAMQGDLVLDMSCYDGVMTDAAAALECLGSGSGTSRSPGGEQNESRRPVVKATQGDFVIGMPDDDAVMSDVAAASGPLYLKPVRSIQHGRALSPDAGRSRIAKSSSRQRERSGSLHRRRGLAISGKEMAVGGILLINTVCSILALYRAS